MKRLKTAGVAAVVLAAALLLAAGAGACSSSPQAPHGAPHLIAVYWTAGGARVLAWSPPAAPDPALVARAPAFASEIDFVFDRRLDGDRIEDTATVNGKTVSRSKVPPPITDDVGVPLDVLYNSAPFYGGETSFVLARPSPAGMPAASAVTFTLDRSAFTSPYDEPLAEPETVQITTEDFAVAIVAPAGSDGGAAPSVPADFRLPLRFSNRTGAPDALVPFVHARVAGAEVAFALLVDAADPTVLYLTPPFQGPCAGAWPGGALVEVSIDAGLPDAFGVPLAAAAAASFTTRAGSGACEAPDGGAPDGGAPDGGAPDAGAPDGGATDGAAD